MQRTAVCWMALLLAATVPAFWPSYFAAPPFEADFLHVHLHGVAMFAWMALLLAQSALIRAGRRELHRALGKVSYLLVPVIVASTLLLAHYRLRQGPPSADLLYFFCVQLGLMIAFVYAYLMAIIHRRAPALHMRYMAGTAIAVVDPILARLLAIYLGVNPPAMQVVTYALVLGLLAALAWRERGNAHAVAWGKMFVVFAIALLPTFVAPQTAAWRGFAEAFARLPLP
jgi:uncharacterized membrane protein